MFEVATPTQLWFKDHLSLLAYVETCAVDKSPGGMPGLAQLDYVHMRVNPQRHPLCAWPALNPREWRATWGTRLSDGTLLGEHDDVDVLDDLASEGLIEIQSLTNALVILTDKGVALAARLRAHRVAGGLYRDFVLADSGAAPPAGAMLSGVATDDPAVTNGAEDPAVSLKPPAGMVWLVSQKGGRRAHLAPDGPGIKQPICGRHLVLSLVFDKPKAKPCDDCLGAAKAKRANG